MTKLRKLIQTTVIPGNPAVKEVIGHPYRPAYTSVKYVPEWKWVDAPGITWKKIPINTSQYITGYWAWVNGERVWKTITTPGLDNVYSGATYMWVPYYYGGPVPAGQLIKEYKRVTTAYTVYHPAEPAVESTSGVSATPNQISHSLNKGWNSYARSINKLGKGEFFVFTAADGITGAFIGLAYPGNQGRQVGFFRHGISVDPAGVVAYENGATVGSLKAVHEPISKIRIHRQPDNTIIYVVTTGTETEVLQSSLTPPGGDLYLYAYLYSGGDVITSAAIQTGKVVFGETK